MELNKLIEKLDAVLAGADASILSNENINANFWLFTSNIDVIEKILKLPKDILSYNALVKGLKMAAYHGETEAVIKILELAIHKIKKHDISEASKAAAGKLGDLHKDVVLKISELAVDKVDGRGISKVITTLFRAGENDEAFQILESYKDRVSKENHPDLSNAFGVVRDLETRKKIWELSEGNIDLYSLKENLISSIQDRDTKMIKQLVKWIKVAAADEIYGADWIIYNTNMMDVAKMLEIAALDNDSELIEEVMSCLTTKAVEEATVTGVIIAGLRRASENGHLDSMLKIWELGKDAILNKEYKYFYRQEIGYKQFKDLFEKGEFSEEMHEAFSVLMKELELVAADQCLPDEDTCPVDPLVATTDIFAEAMASLAIN